MIYINRQLPQEILDAIDWEEATIEKTESYSVYIMWNGYIVAVGSPDHCEEVLRHRIKNQLNDLI